ncbi:hypothetical protein [Pedobacter sp. N23S346]|uniref:hypothetical protein n=1 Tax=Pedobacter sp. N23S346 TaxID=3402750 RepID=UPI003ACE5DD9
MDKTQFNKTQRLVNRIQTGNFDDLDVDNLLIAIRESAIEPQFDKLKEICNFIAHPNRDKGLIKDGITRSFYFMLFFEKYITQKEIIDFEQFPIWLKYLLELQLSLYEDKNLPISRERCKQVINSIPKVPKNLSHYSAVKITKNITDLDKILRTLTNSLFAQPVIIQKSFIDDLINLFNNIKIKFNESIIKQQSDNIMNCIAYMLHGKTIIISTDSARLVLFKEEDQIKKMELVSIYGQVEVSMRGTSLNILFCVMQSDLKVTDRFSKELLKKAILNPDDEILLENFVLNLKCND